MFVPSDKLVKKISYWAYGGSERDAQEFKQWFQSVNPHMAMVQIGQALTAPQGGVITGREIGRLFLKAFGG